MAAVINLRHFVPYVPPIAPAPEDGAAPAAHLPENILNTGNIHLVINDINNRPWAPTQKIEALLSCIFQSMDSKKPHAGNCRSQLKNRLFEIILTYPSIAQTIIKNPNFKHNEQLKEILDKIDYLTSGIFGFNNHSSLRYAGKFFHHFSETYFENKHSGFSCFALGIGLSFMGGLQIVFSDDPTKTSDNQKKKLGWGMFYSGIGTMAAPLVQVFYRAKGENP